MGAGRVIINDNANVLTTTYNKTVNELCSIQRTLRKVNMHIAKGKAFGFVGKKGVS